MWLFWLFKPSPRISLHDFPCSTLASNYQNWGHTLILTKATVSTLYSYQLPLNIINSVAKCGIKSGLICPKTKQWRAQIWQIMFCITLKPLRGLSHPLMDIKNPTPRSYCCRQVKEINLDFSNLISPEALWGNKAIKTHPIDMGHWCWCLGGGFLVLRHTLASVWTSLSDADTVCRRHNIVLLSARDDWGSLLLHPDR